VSKTNRKSFQIDQPSLSQAEEDAFDGVLKRLRSSPAPLANQSTSQPVNQIASQPDNQSTSAEPVENSLNWSTGQPKLVDQLNALANQSTSQPDSQSTSQPVDRLAIEKTYPSRKHKKLKGIRLPIQKLEKYELWCFLNKTDFQDAAEFALDWLTSQPVNRMLIDDNSDDPDDEISSIRIFYEQWTGNKVSPKDREAMREVLDVPLERVQLGILVGLARTSQKRINSFRYFVPVIWEMADNPVQNLEGGYMAHLMKIVSRKENSDSGNSS